MYEWFSYQKIGRITCTRRERVRWMMTGVRSYVSSVQISVDLERIVENGNVKTVFKIL